MKLNDLELIAIVEALGLRMADLFLVCDRVYRSEDAGDFRSDSRYMPCDVLTAEQEGALVSLLRRLAAPEYASTEQIDDEIAQCREWGSLYEELMVILGGHGKYDPFGDGDFCLADDNFGSLQHMVECSRSNFFSPSIVAEVQNVLTRYSRRWEVIFALPAVEGKKHTYHVFVDACVEHLG